MLSHLLRIRIAVSIRICRIALCKFPRHSLKVCIRNIKRSCSKHLIRPVCHNLLRFRGLQILLQIFSKVVSTCLCLSLYIALHTSHDTSDQILHLCCRDHHIPILLQDGSQIFTDNILRIIRCQILRKMFSQCRIICFRMAFHIFTVSFIQNLDHFLHATWLHRNIKM